VNGLALTPEQQQVLALIEKHQEPMPDYVKEYMLSKKRAGLSPNTLLQYLYRYKYFFNWTLSEGIISALKVDTAINLQLLLRNYDMNVTWRGL